MLQSILGQFLTCILLQENSSKPFFFLTETCDILVPPEGVNVLIFDSLTFPCFNIVLYAKVLAATAPTLHDIFSDQTKFRVMIQFLKMIYEDMCEICNQLPTPYFKSVPHYSNPRFVAFLIKIFFYS